LGGASVVSIVGVAMQVVATIVVAATAEEVALMDTTMTNLLKRRSGSSCSAMAQVATAVATASARILRKMKLFYFRL